MDWVELAHDGVKRRGSVVHGCEPFGFIKVGKYLSISQTFSF